MLTIFIKSIKKWFSDDPFTHSAAAAYYAIFSFPGLIIITMTMAAFAFDQQQVETDVVGKISQILGEDTAKSLHKIVQNIQSQDRDFWALIVGAVTLFFGATGLFAHLQRALNKIFEVEVKKTAKFGIFLKRRLISFSVVLVLGFLLLMSLSLTAMITLLNEWITAQFSMAFSSVMLGVNVTLSLSIVILLFSLIYKILPDAKLKWRAALMGGIVATIFFKIGEYGLNLYFELAEPQSSFGAAGSLVLLMLWVFYSCMILFIGAEFSKNYAQAKYGHKVKPNEIAKKKI